MLWKDKTARTLHEEVNSSNVIALEIYMLILRGNKRFEKRENPSNERGRLLLEELDIAILLIVKIQRQVYFQGVRKIL